MNNIIFLGCTQNYGYQFSAGNTKVEMIAKGLHRVGDTCVVLNGLVGKKDLLQNRTVLEKEIGSVVTYKKYGSSLFSWIMNLKQLYKDLRKYKNSDRKNFVVVTDVDYHLFLSYSFFSIICGYKMIAITHEWFPIVESVRWIKKPSVWLYNKTYGYIVDGIWPISEYIIQKTKHFKKPYIKVPILADFSNESINVVNKKKRFVYCVGALYFRVIKIIIDAYKRYVINGGENSLTLVLSGPLQAIENVSSYINAEGLRENVEICSKLPYSELQRLYSESTALIIPLDKNNEQDHARFSQKIAEYLSSGTPIITNWVGEIPIYFRDKENVIIAQSCDVKGFLDSFVWVDNNQDKLLSIGTNGRNLGVKEFNCNTYGILIHDYLNHL